MTLTNVVDHEADGPDDHHETNEGDNRSKHLNIGLLRGALARPWHAGPIKRLTATVAAAALFVFAVVLALSFANPAQSPPSSGGTVRLFLALGALLPAGLAAYLAGRGEYRQALRAAIVVAVLYGAFFVVAFAGPSSSG